MATKQSSDQGGSSAQNSTDSMTAAPGTDIATESASPASASSFQLPEGQTLYGGGDQPESVRQMKVVRIDHEFQYRGANFEAGKYYAVYDEPVNFVDWHIKHNRQGAEVNNPSQLPAGTEILPDPRIAAKLVEGEGTFVRPRPEGPVSSVPGEAEAGPSSSRNFASHDNLFGGVHTSTGETKPGEPLRTGFASDAAREAAAKADADKAASAPADAATKAAGDTSAAAAASSEAARPRIPRPAVGT